ncbi:MAG: amidohydrolase, partial [Deltaproteobacteria bacterium]|nr:amidohydrolase [Deltaproteobacteria bacterium]
VDLVFAGHMEPDLEVGTIGIFKGTGYAAADLFFVTITGQGGHGGRPHKTRDPLTAGAYFVTALQTLVARNMNPMDPAVVSLGKFHSGAVGNIIPESAVLEGTIRTHSTAARNLIIKRLTELTKGLETLFDVKCQLDIEAETPCCNNDEQLSLFLYDIGSDLLGKNRVKWLQPTMGSEDFAFFTKERPSAIVRLGCCNTAKGITAPLHSPYFDIDEAVLDIGVQFFLKALTTYLTPETDNPT